ncbi:hypothetical protein ACSST1_04935 [Pantoea agglomerans]|jgi:hypothetical protein|uniref:hypothetical protein n=1 Tax=Pantoea TaxID=53335 RepID=UPI000F01FFB0|nr:hypothetical protein [Pantoea agglomerans]AYP22504.1 hypothetical protein D0A61_05820 [Pantoea agglomerans]
MSLKLLQQAIQERKPISFEYNKEGKVHGERFGNPHAIFIMRKKDESESTKVHLVQTAGVTDSDKGYNEFRMFDILEITNVKILDDESPFEIHPSYNPSWPGYASVIAKV